MTGSPQLEALRARVRSNLMSGQCQRINFVYDNVYIDGSGYSFVALASLSKSSNVLDVAIDAKQTSEAMYLPKTNRLVFKNPVYGITPFERMAIIHECTHALIDGRRKWTSMLTSEVCSYIAGAVFNLNLFEDTNQRFDEAAQPVGGVYHEASKVAAKMARIRGRFKYTACFNLMSGDTELEALVSSVRASSTRYNKLASYGESGLSL